LFGIGRELFNFLQQLFYTLFHAQAQSTKVQ
jgi:hypothetical protein